MSRTLRIPGQQVRQGPRIIGWSQTVGHVVTVIVITAGTRVTRGHARTRTLQVRLNDEEYEALSRAAKAQHLPESTFARSVLLDALDMARKRVAMGQAIVRDTDLDQARELIGELGSLLGVERRSA